MIDFVFLCFCVGVVLVSGCLSFFIGGLMWEFFRFLMSLGFWVLLVFGICYFGFWLGGGIHDAREASPLFALLWLAFCVLSWLFSCCSGRR